MLVLPHQFVVGHKGSIASNRADNRVGCVGHGCVPRGGERGGAYTSSDAHRTCGDGG